MMQHFQSILIAVGVMAIASVLVHGYLLSRKDKAAVLEFASDTDVLIEPGNSILGTEVVNNEISITNENDASDEEYIDFSQALSEDNDVVFLDGVKKIQDDQENEIDDVFNSETVQENIVSFTFKKSKNKNDANIETANTGEPEDNNQFIDAISGQTTLKQASPINESEKPESSKEQTPDVFIFNVVAKEGATLGGLQLLQFFLTSGFRFGEMSLFHRHLHSDGTGPILFSIANMLAPGTFDPQHMEKFDTQGVSFFIAAPNWEINIKEAFEMMLTAVEQLSEEFDCTVLNAQREPLTEQQFRDYHERLMRYV